MDTTLRVGIIGATSYTGSELARLLALHPRAELVAATASGERAGVPLSELFPSLRGVCDLVTEELSMEALAARCDFVFVALGHGKALEMVPQLLQAGLKVCDLGADFRLRDTDSYAEWYKLPHTAAITLREAVYGLPEWQREAIKKARVVANPGCYVTTAVLALAPFMAQEALKPNSLIVDAASGVSGAGRSSFGVGTHFPELYGDFKAYNVASHRHTPEIEQGLSDALPHVAAETKPRLTFTAHLLPIARGILATCYADPVEEGFSAGDAHDILTTRYASEPFVRVLPPGQFPQIKAVVGSNFCDLGVTVDARTGRVIVIGTLDNVLKGASGQAIQNMNLMCGFPETDALQSAAIFP